MGHITKFNLTEFIQTYKLTTFVETGTFEGNAIEHALKFNFNNYYSVELLEKFYIKCVNKFKNDINVHLLNLNSIEGLENITKYSLKRDENTLFWLDAHLPNFYCNYNNDYINDSKILIPLEEEIKTIKNNKDISNDVFIIDDLRIYETGPYQNGNWHDVINTKLYPEGASFVDILLKDTHTVIRNYDSEGFLICTPIKQNTQ